MGLFKRGPSQTAPGRSRQRLRRKTYIIHHYCPHTFNAGDHFVVRSIRQHLKELLPEALFVPKACADNRGWGKPIGLRGGSIDFSNRHADAVIVGGSDQYNNWSLRIRAREIRRLVPPLYLIGLGVSSRSLQDPPRIDKDSYREDIRVTNEVARLSSVRDDYTRRFLESLGYHGSVVTGCPSLYLFDHPFHLGRDGVVALTFPFPVVRRDNWAAYSALMDSIKGLIDMSKRLDLAPVIACHDDRDVTAAEEIFPEESIFFSNYVDDFFDFYRRSMLVIGSRLHASILAAGLGKPFININLDVRGRGFSETFGLSEWNLDMGNPHLVDRVEERVRTILSGDLSVFEAFSAVRTRYRKRYFDFMDSVARSIKSSMESDG